MSTVYITIYIFLYHIIVPLINCGTLPTTLVTICAMFASSKSGNGVSTKHIDVRNNSYSPDGAVLRPLWEYAMEISCYQRLFIFKLSAATSQISNKLTKGLFHGLITCMPTVPNPLIRAYAVDQYPDLGLFPWSLSYSAHSSATHMGWPLHCRTPHQKIHYHPRYYITIIEETPIHLPLAS